MRVLEGSSVNTLWKRNCCCAWLADLLLAASVLVHSGEEGQRRATFEDGYTEYWRDPISNMYGKEWKWQWPYLRGNIGCVRIHRVEDCCEGQSLRSITKIDLLEETEVCKRTKKPCRCCIGGKVRSEWHIAVLEIDAPGGAEIDIERAACHGHDLRHLQGEGDEEDGM